MPEDRRLIALDDQMMRLRTLIEAAGYDVVRMHEVPLDRVAAIVVNGLDANILGGQRRLTPVPIIDASGLTGDELVKAIRSRVEA